MGVCKFKRYYEKRKRVAGQSGGRGKERRGTARRREQGREEKRNELCVNNMQK